MSESICIGDRGRTLGPLKPTGKVIVGERELQAVSEDGWVDAGEEVFVTGGDLSRVTICTASKEAYSGEKEGQRLPERGELVADALEFPSTWVEEANAVGIGVVAGGLLLVSLWIAGAPLSIRMLMLPLSCALAGWVFRLTVRTAIESVGPREDHRPRARLIAGCVILGSILGAAVGLQLSAGVVGLAAGISVGAALFGMLSYLVIILAIL